MGLSNTVKHVINSVYMGVTQTIYRFAGRRKVSAFGKKIYVTPDTIFPSYYNFKLPKKQFPSRIVQYTDFVQLNAICAHLTNMPGVGTVIDIGAHHGAYAILCGKIIQNKGGKVIAAEPNPESYKVLLQNIQLNSLEDIVIPINCGIFNKKGTMSIADHGSQSRLLAQDDKGGSSIDVFTLDWILNKYRIESVDILLVDVEGAELPVLQGFPWGAIQVEKIFCELHPYAWPDFSYTANDFADFLNKHSLHCFDMYFQKHHLVQQQAYIGPTLIVVD